MAVKRILVSASLALSIILSIFYMSAEAAWQDPEFILFVGSSSVLPSEVPETTPPTGSININGGAASTGNAAVTLNLSASDGAGSGVALMRFSNDGSNWFAWEGYAITKAWNLTAGNGIKTVYVQFKDNAGNVSDPVSASITLNIPGSTPVGNTVTVSPNPKTTVTFSGVTVEGTTIITEVTGMSAPANFTFFGKVYDIQTTASYIPPVILSFNYDDTGMTLPQEQNLKLLHFEGGSWKDVTTSVDTINNIVRGSVNSLSPFVLAKPLTAAISSPSLSTKTSKSTTFKVTWSGNDGGSAPASYDVQSKIGSGGSWTNWKKGATTTSAKFKGKPGKTYYFRVRAKGAAGNASAWSAETKTIVPFDNDSLITGRSGFVNSFSKASSSFYLGTVRYSTIKGESITYKFTGKSVALISTKGKTYSKAKIYIDGKYKKTVDAKARATKTRQALFAMNLKAGKHKIKIKNLGTPGRTRFDVDGLGIGR